MTVAPATYCTRAAAVQKATTFRRTESSQKVEEAKLYATEQPRFAPGAEVPELDDVENEAAEDEMDVDDDIEELKAVVAVLPKFASEDEDWQRFGWLLDSPEVHAFEDLVEVPEADDVEKTEEAVEHNEFGEGPSGIVEYPKKEQLESEVEQPKEQPERRITRSAKRAARSNRNTSSAAASAKPREVINPADISLGGDAVDWTKVPLENKEHEVKREEEDTEVEESIAFGVARRRRTSTTSRDDDDQLRRNKERRLSESREPRNRTVSRSSVKSEVETKPLTEMATIRERTPDIDLTALHCICQTLYDQSKFYMMCDLCSRWYHGACVKVSEKKAQRMLGWQCPECIEEEQRVKSAPQLYCICQKPYDDTKFYVGCDSCEGWFHPACVSITQDQAEAMAEYICPQCTNEGYESSSSDSSVASSASPLTREDYSELYQLVDLLTEHRMSTSFRQPVDIKQFPDYLEVVQNPIDLSMISRKLGSLEYHYLKDFTDDVTQMFENAKIYNPKDSPIFKCAETLQEFFDGKIAMSRQILGKRGERRRVESESRTLDDIDTDQLISLQLDPRIIQNLNNLF